MPPKNVKYTAKQSAGYYKSRTAGRAASSSAAAKASRSRAFSDRRAIRASSARVSRGTGFVREKKYIDTSLALNFDNSSAVASCLVSLNIVPQSNTVTSRIGKKIAMKALQIKGAIYAGVASGDKVSMMLVYDREPNKAATVPPVTDILVSHASTSLTNRDNAARYKILKRWNYGVAGSIQTASAPENSIICVDEYIKLGGLETLWSAADTTGVVANMVRGDLLLLTVGDGANGASTPTLVATARLDFDDQ